jgi:hypothetical protein
VRPLELDCGPAQVGCAGQSEEEEEIVTVFPRAAGLFT